MGVGEPNEPKSAWGVVVVVVVVSSPAAGRLPWPVCTISTTLTATSGATNALHVAILRRFTV
jgi:hypothetical protein